MYFWVVRWVVLGWLSLSAWGQVVIYRDSFGTPHIFGETDADCAYGIAWAHAEDDFMRLQYVLALAKARLGRWMGKEGATMDYFAHFTGAFRLAKQYYDSLPLPMRRILEAYAEALNAYAAQHPKAVLDPGLFPARGEDILRGYIVVLSGMIGVGQALKAAMQDKAHTFSVAAGSNAIAIHRSHTEEGATFLLINPHVPIEGVFRWYEAYLHSQEGWQVLGGFFPGSVAPGLGTNPYLGWGVTFNWPDFVDTYRLTLHPKNPRLYRVDEDWETLGVEKVHLVVRLFPKKGRMVQGWPIQGFSRVKGPFLTVKRTLEWSRFGPVVRTKKAAYALRFPAERFYLAPYEWYLLSKARSFQEFYQALSLQGIPLFNFVYADPDTIFYLFNALLPVRSPQYNWQGVLPGNTKQTLWTRYLSLAELPQVCNPACGYVFSVNNSPFLVSCPEASPREADFSAEQGFSWNRHNNREYRLRELMEGRSRFSWQDFVAIKYDKQYPEVGPIRGVWAAFANLPDTTQPLLAEALRVVRRWDFSGRLESDAAPLITLAVYYAFRKHSIPGYNWLEQGRSELPVQARWEALGWAARQLKRHYGRLAVPLGKVQGLYVRDTLYPLGGLPEQLAPTYGTWDEKRGFMRVEAGDTYIQMVRFYPAVGQAARPLPVIESIFPMGVSADPKSPHYADQLPLFVAGKRKLMTLDPAAIRAKAVRTYALSRLGPQAREGVRPKP